MDDAQTPLKEFTGFVVFLSAKVLFAVYVAWAFVPDWMLVALGVSWYPSREWALLLPSFLTMTVVFTYIFYLSLNIYNTAPLRSLDNITDDAAIYSSKGSTKDQDPRTLPDPPPAVDLSVSRVNRALFR